MNPARKKFWGLFKVFEILKISLFQNVFKFLEAHFCMPTFRCFRRPKRKKSEKKRILEFLSLAEMVLFYSHVTSWTVTVLGVIFWSSYFCHLVVTRSYVKMLRNLVRCRFWSSIVPISSRKMFQTTDNVSVKSFRPYLRYY